MADYETLSDGGFENLVGKLKDYDDRPNGVTTVQLANGAVITEKLGDSSVTAQKLNNNAVTTSKLAGGSVTDDKLDPGGLISDVATLRHDMQNLDVTVDPDDFSLEQDDETKLVYIVYRGERSSNGIPLAGGGGGGGGGGTGNNAVLTVTNESGWLARTVSAGGRCVIDIEWSSVENEIPTGDGTLTITIGGVVRTTQTVSQGTLSYDVGPLLSTGSNKVKVKISDIYDNTRTITYTITSVELSLLSSFDTSNTFAANTAIEYTYIPKGALEKTVHFVVDGTELQTETVTVSGRQQTKTIPGMTHGSHSLLVYFEVTIDEQAVRSNELYYDFIVVNAQSNIPVIACQFNRGTATQFEMLSIPYTVYTPGSLTSTVQLLANGNLVNQITVGRAEQIWSYRCVTTGQLTLQIKTGTITKDITLTVAESEVDVHAETQDLSLYLSTYGRSNAEEHPEVWEDEQNEVAATLTGFSFVSDGWVSDTDGNTVLRVANDARVTIPYQPFATDFRSTGKTLEFEFATHDIYDYDAVVISCMSGGRGFQLTAQQATLSSEQSTISTQYKENEHVRVTFVAEKRTEDRLLLLYINGIASGCVQYPDDDDFSQQVPVNITIGSSSCATDIYCVRIYDNDLTRYQVLDNWIADTQDADLMMERYQRNEVYDEYGTVTIENLPNDLPYMVIEAAELPQYKGDKKTVSGYYVDPVNAANSFSFESCQINVQGTSSAVYDIKNFDLQFKEGFDMTLSGAHADNFALAPSVVPFNRFVLKADVASSEGANNVELVKLYNDASPYDRPEEIADPKVRKGIYGFPIVMFWHDTTSGETTFYGKMNFNLPKRAPGPYGYSGNMESWEFQNNTSNLMLFLTDYFDQTMLVDPDTGEAKETWRYDYEARFPSDTWTDYSKLQELQSFVYGTYRAEATGDALASSVTYDGVTYTTDSAAYRLAKFRAEFGNYAEVSSFIFYYIFTELFLMVDSRAKNLFIGFSGGDATGMQHIDRKAVAEPYDMDTAIGTNNEGALVFGYSLEDTDTLTGGANVFNGQNSVLWCNLRDAFGPEIAQMYKTLRANGVLSYASVEQRFEDHQGKWPEAIYNEDAWVKYVGPLIAPSAGKEPSSSYLSMMQGSKEEQRKWWLFNRFRYMDSKWGAGDAIGSVIELRGYAKANITVTPYSDIYASIKYASYTVTERGTHGVPVTLVCPLDTLNDSEIHIYSAPQLASVGDLSGLKVGRADFRAATSLQSIIVGSNASGYENPNLTELYVGNSPLLTTIDARNCTALAGSVDFSGAANLEHVYLSGTAVTSVSLPVGGILKTLQLPATITNLTVRNQPAITSFSVEGSDYSTITTLRVENSAATVPVMDILDAMEPNSRVRIIGFSATAESTQDVEDFFDFLDTMRGLDEYGNNLDNAVVAGSITGLDTITGAWLAEMNTRYPDVSIGFEHISSTLTYKSYDGSTTIQTETITDGGNGTYSGTPSRTATAQYSYSFVGWSRYQDQTVADPTATQNVMADRTVYAAYSATLRNYTVKWANKGGAVLETDTNVPYGTVPTYDGATPTYGGETSTGWSPAVGPVTGNTTYTAVYEPVHTITDTWAQIIQHVQTGDYATRYSVGDTMALDLGSEGFVNMQIAGFDLDDKADGTGKAAISWIGVHLLPTFHRMNPVRADVYVYDQGPSFERASSATYFGNYNKWNAKNAYTANNTARITIAATAVATDTLRLTYGTGRGTDNLTSLKVDGTEIITSHETNSQTYDLALTEGTSYTIVFETTKLSVTDMDVPYLMLCDTSGNGSATTVDALVTQTISIDDCVVRSTNGYQEGTGTIGGWESSEMRAYLRGTVRPLIPAEVRAAIKEVSKTQWSYGGSTGSVSQTTTDDVWIPSRNEVFGETVLYYGLFQDTNANRAKTTLDGISRRWWTREAYSSTNFICVGTGGAMETNRTVSSAEGIALGFCI